MRKFLDIRFIFAQLSKAGKSLVGQPLGPCPGSNSLLWEEARAGRGPPLALSPEGSDYIYLRPGIGRAQVWGMGGSWRQ